ncbi:hypothetical protein EC991_006385 [Linnemannia zychae]|nr:hypothetical protein EC991_006385 [Linnemannia zychae]
MPIVVALATAVALSLVSQVPPIAVASPIVTPNPRQNTFARPSAKPVTVCGTVIGIDFDEEFSVGFVNLTNQVELIPNKDGDIYTPSYVRIIEFPDDNSREIIFGKDAITRPLNEREEKLKDTMRKELMKYWKESSPRNYTLPVPDILNRFEPDQAYGVGERDNINVHDFYWRFSRSIFYSARDKWENVSPVPNQPIHPISYPPTPRELLTGGIVRGGLFPLRVLEQSEAAVLAYEPQIAKVERMSGGRPQTVVFYYLSLYGEGISVFETSRDPAEEDFLHLKTVAKYHPYQSVRERMEKAMEQQCYEKYIGGSYVTMDTPRKGCDNCEWILRLESSDPKKLAMRFLEDDIQKISQQSRTWPLDDPEDDAKEEHLFVSMTEYVVVTHKEWLDFERVWLKRHFGAMLDRAYGESGVEVKARPQRIDHFLIVDESGFRKKSSDILREVLGGSAELNELTDPAIEHKFGIVVSHGVARVADYHTKRSSHHSCQ